MKTPRTLSQSIIVFSTLVESLFFGVMDRKKKEGEEKRKKKKHLKWTQFCLDFRVLRRVAVLPSNLCQTINFSSEHDRG